MVFCYPRSRHAKRPDMWKGSISNILPVAVGTHVGFDSSRKSLSGYMSQIARTVQCERLHFAGHVEHVISAASKPGAVCQSLSRRGFMADLHGAADRTS